MLGYHQNIVINGRKISAYKADDTSPLVIMNGMEGDGERIKNALLYPYPFSLAVIESVDWYKELTPWPIAKFASWGKACAGEAESYIKELETIILGIIRTLSIKPVYIAIAGYSLAGLFALYSVYTSSLFSRFACVSGSLWYPGIAEYVETHEMKSRVEKAYFSLGAKEAKTKNALISTVEERTIRIERTLSDKGIETAFVLNPGNHFQDSAKRIASALLWMISS